MAQQHLSLSIVTLAFALFVVCPRMGAMTALLDRQAQIPIYWLVILGTFASIPLLLLMAWAIRTWGLLAGLGLAVATDLLAALILTSVDLKVAVETFIIATFVVAGNRLATWLTQTFF